MQKGCFYAGLLMPFLGHEYTKKKKVVTAVQHILAESLKQSNDVQKFVTTSLNLLPEMDRLVTQFAHKNVEDLSQDDIYSLAQGIITIDKYYHAVTLLHVAMSFKNEGSGLDHTPISKDINVVAVEEALNTHEKLNQLIDKTKMRNIHLVKPMIDGKGIQLLYGCKPGKHMKPLIDECVKFQILNLDASYQDAEEYMLKNKDDFMAKHGAA